MTFLDADGARDIWLWDMGRETFGRRSFGSVDGTAIWNPDGDVIYYQSERNPRAEIWSVMANGSSRARLVTSTPFNRIDLETVSPDGQSLVYSVNSSEGSLSTSLGEASQELTHTELIGGQGYRRHREYLPMATGSLTSVKKREQASVCSTVPRS